MTDVLRAAYAAKFARDLTDLDVWRTVHGHSHADHVACHPRCARVTQSPTVTRALIRAAYGPAPRRALAGYSAS